MHRHSMPSFTSYNIEMKYRTEEVVVIKYKLRANNVQETYLALHTVHLSLLEAVPDLVILQFGLLSWGTMLLDSII